MYVLFHVKILQRDICLYANQAVGLLVRSCGICGGQSGTGADFHRVLRFPLSFISLAAIHNTIHQKGADLQSGLSVTL
jgi:hypothetical protein